MTDDRDFKRLVRQRMAKTGESYTAARAHLRTGGDAAPSAAGAIDAFRERAYTRKGTDRLAPHLEARYGVRVRRTSELDVGVFRVDLHDRPSWVARVFPAARPLEAVAGDAEILRFLERHALPSERCAHADAVSTLDGQGVLVTEHVPGVNARTDRSGQLMHVLGELLGRVHALPAETGAMARDAGSWHHLSLGGGGRQEDVATLLPLLADAARGVAADERPLYESLRGELARLDDCRDLPHALIHPDPCTANVIASNADAPVLVDWTGAGTGPRIASLANLIAGSPELRLVDAAVAGYRRHVQLEDDELVRLDGALQAFPLIIACWYFVFQDAPLREVVARISTHRDRASAIAKRAHAAFHAHTSALAEWDEQPEPGQREIEGQGTLL